MNLLRRNQRFLLPIFREQNWSLLVHPNQMFGENRRMNFYCLGCNLFWLQSYGMLRYGSSIQRAWDQIKPKELN